MFNPQKQNNNASDSSSKYPEGVWFQRWTINDIVKNPNNPFDQDINLIAMVNNGKLEYDKRFWLAGNHEKEQGVAVDYGTNKTVKQGGSFYIKKFIEATGVDPLTALNDKGDDFKDDVKADLIGRSLILCEYPSNGKVKSEFWRTVCSESEGDNVLREKWLEMFKDKEQHKYVPNRYEHAEEEKAKWSSEEYAPSDKHAAAFEAEDDGMPF